MSDTAKPSRLLLTRALRRLAAEVYTGTIASPLEIQARLRVLAAHLPKDRGVRAKMALVGPTSLFTVEGLERLGQDVLKHVSGDRSSFRVPALASKEVAVSFAVYPELAPLFWVTLVADEGGDGVFVKYTNRASLSTHDDLSQVFAPAHYSGTYQAIASGVIGDVRASLRSADKSYLQWEKALGREALEAAREEVARLRGVPVREVSPDDDEVLDTSFLKEEELRDRQYFTYT